MTESTIKRLIEHNALLSKVRENFIKVLGSLPPNNVVYSSYKVS